MACSRVAAAVKAGRLGLLVPVMLGAFLKAQGNRLYGGGGWFWVQYGGMMGLGPLADGLKAQGLSYQVPTGSAALGGGGGAYQGRLHVGGEGGYLFGDGIEGGGGWARLGYFFPLKGGFLVMPVGMIGGCGLSFEIRGEGGSVPFNQVAAATLPVRYLSTGGLITGGALEVQKNFGGFLLGLSVGYLAGPSWNDWELEEGVTISGAPRVSPGIPYIRLQIGGGGWGSVEQE